MELARPEELGFSPSRLARILPAMQGYVDRRQVAGVVTLIARRGRVVHFETSGMMGVETTRPMRRDAIFRIYSMTKPITSAAAMMLFEEGKFRLGDPISRYLPMFKDMKVLVNKFNGDTELVPARREITVRDLFTHTAGLSYGFDPNTYIDELYRQKLWGAIEKDPNTTLEQLVEEVAKLPLVQHPGAAFHYSFSIDVLGYLVQVVSGKPFDTFLKERIFDPLGMSDTAFWVPPEKMSRFTTTCGPTEDGGLKAIDSPTTSNYAKPARFLSGGGGLVSTTEDYLRFCQMLLNQGRLGNARLLGRKTVELMFANHLTPDVPFTDPGLSFGLGGSVVVDPAATQRLGSVGIWSWGGAANTNFWIDPREELIAIMMLQYMPAFVLPIHIDFNNLVYQALVD